MVQNSRNAQLNILDGLGVTARQYDPINYPGRTRLQIGDNSTTRYKQGMSVEDFLNNPEIDEYIKNSLKRLPPDAQREALRVADAAENREVRLNPADYGLENFDLSGQGHPLAYDKVVPNQVNKLLKPFGGKVDVLGEAYVPRKGRSSTGTQFEPVFKGRPAPAIGANSDVIKTQILGALLTPEMKKLIKEKGFYALGPLMAAILGNQGER